MRWAVVTGMVIRIQTVMCLCWFLHVLIYRWVRFLMEAQIPSVRPCSLSAEITSTKRTCAIIRQNWCMRGWDALKASLDVPIMKVSAYGTDKERYWKRWSFSLVVAMVWKDGNNGQSAKRCTIHTLWPIESRQWITAMDGYFLPSTDLC